MIRTLGILLVIAALPALAKDPNVDPNRSVYGSCILCHGIDGRGSEPQDAAGTQMRAAADALPDEQSVRDVIAYINSLE